MLHTRVFLSHGLLQLVIPTNQHHP